MTARRSRRDLAAEVGMLIAADAELSAQSWVPLQPGDVVLRYVPAAGDVPARGTTYLAVEEGTDVIGHAMLREVSHTGPAFDDRVDVDEGKLDYVLRYDTGDELWRLDWRDIPLSGPEPWLDAPRPHWRRRRRSRAGLGRRRDSPERTLAGGSRLAGDHRPPLHRGGLGRRRVGQSGGGAGAGFLLRPVDGGGP
jgi:hypothetical protein